jgi:regulator of sirC expression with transglutaminase-like and TPR domain
MAADEGTDALGLFRAVVSVPDEQLDLAEAALLVAQAEYPALDRGAYRARLEQMAGEAGKASRGNTLERIAGLNQLLYGRLGFRGNQDDYYDPRNSFLNEVLDRRTGIPISLSLVYIEVGRRAGLDLVGVGLPAHFLVGVAGRSDLYVDAFSEGSLMTAADCVERLRELRPDLPFRPEFLDPVSGRQLLTRLLNNLLMIYSSTSRYPKALAMLERIFCLEPEEPEWLRQRAVVHYHLKNYARAIADLQAYLERVPNAPDHEELAQQLAVLQHLRSMVN